MDSSSGDLLELERAGAQVLQVSGHLGDRLGEHVSLARGDPAKPQPLLADPEGREDPVEQGHAAAGLEVPVDVVAVPGVAPADQDPVGSFRQTEMGGPL